MKVALAMKWRDDNKVTLTSKYIGSDDEVFAAIKAGQVYDIAMTFNPFMQRFAEAKVIQPIDTSRLKNWGDMFEGLRSADFLNVNGVPYGVPIAWGDGPYVYNPAKVKDADKPHSILDLLDPKWKKRLTIADDPGFVFYLGGLALGFPSPNLTKAQLQQVADTFKPLIKEQTVAFAKTYADATDLLVRGEADLTTLGWEAMLNFAKDKGGTLAFDFFKEARGGWSDSMTIPVNAANIDAAYAYIDAVIAPDVSAQMAVSLVSGAVNQKAVPLIPAADNIYNYDVVKTKQTGVFEDTLAPETPTDPNIASHQDWLDAWAKLTA
jgi:spermidine/putrescine-binding protein